MYVRVSGGNSEQEVLAFVHRPCRGTAATARRSERRKTAPPQVQKRQKVREDFAGRYSSKTSSSTRSTVARPDRVRAHSTSRSTRWRDPGPPRGRWWTSRPRLSIPAPPTSASPSSTPTTHSRPAHPAAASKQDVSDQVTRRRCIENDGDGTTNSLPAYCSLGSEFCRDSNG